MKINRCGYQFRHPKGFSFSRPFGSGDYWLTVAGAPFFVFLNGKIVEAPANTVLLVKKGSLHFVAASGDGWLNDWVHFDVDDEELPWLESLNLPYDQLLELENAPELSSIICKMCRERESGLPNSQQAALLYLQLLLYKLSDMWLISRSSNPPLKQNLYNLRALIRAHPEEAWYVEDLAQRFSISVSHFQHKYKAYFGCSLKKDVTAARILRAKALLVSEHSVAEVARMCGYNSDIHFMRMFKAETGLTPTEYRSRLDNKYPVFETKELWRHPVRSEEEPLWEEPALELPPD